MRESLNSGESEHLTRELQSMADADQAMRRFGAWDNEIDIKHTTRLKQIVAKTGWPTISRFGKKTAHNAWLLIQHADHDPEFQLEILNLLKALPDGEVDKPSVAYLEDRVRVNANRPTLFGTQFYTDELGNFGPRPIDDIEGLDERRAQAGLEPFAEYKKHMDELHEEHQRNRQNGGTK